MKERKKEKDVIIINSDISDSVKLYFRSVVDNSKIGNKSVVGDFSRVYHSVLSNKNRIDRNTLIYHSIMDDYSYVGRNSTIMHSEIGKFCSISWGVSIGPANHDYSFLSSHDFLYNDYYELKPKNKIAYDRFEKKTKIGSDVWIGANSVITNGVEVGDGAVIGAGSIVTKNIPPYAIAVGSPAKVIKKRFSNEIIEDLLKLKWWNFDENFIIRNWDILKGKNIEKIINKLKK